MLDQVNGTLIAAGVAGMLFLAHIVSVTWFLRGIKSRNDLVVQSVHSLGKELRSDIGRLNVSILGLTAKIESLMRKMNELDLGMAVVKQRVTTIEKEGSGGNREARET